MSEQWVETIRRALAPTASPEDALRRRVLEAVLAPTGPGHVTYEEFLAWADEDTLAEWVNGEVVMTSPASRQHQDIADFLTSVMRAFVESRNLGVVLSAPFQMKLDALHGREPDLLFIAQDHLDRLRETHLDGPADMVIEIISSESIGRDRGDKFREYEQGGVPEYWLIDPLARRAEFYRLEQERYRLLFIGEEGQYRSQALPGFWLQVEWLWQQPLPQAARVTWEIMGIDELRRLLAELERIEAQGT
jgi:Uma2 family endonuclease